MSCVLPSRIAVFISSLRSFKQISWSGCKDSQTSADTFEAGQSTGAMSYVRRSLHDLALFALTYDVQAFMTCLRKFTCLLLSHLSAHCDAQARTSSRATSSCFKAFGRLLYLATFGLLRDIDLTIILFRAILKQKYSQKPQLSSSHPMVSFRACDVAFFCRRY